MNSYASKFSFSLTKLKENYENVSALKMQKSMKFRDN